MTRIEARHWIRRHFAEYIRLAEFGSEDPESDVDFATIGAVFSDEVHRISKRILAGIPEGDPLNDKPKQ